MHERGDLIRHTLVKDLEHYRALLATEMGESGRDAYFEGRDSLGAKARIPWVRWASISRSPSAQRGWFVVYLFHPSGVGVSLCLMHGATDIINNEFIPKSAAATARFNAFALATLGDYFSGDANVRRGIDLGRGAGLPSYYERAVVFSKFYPAERIPEDAALVADLRLFARALAKLYLAKSD